MTGLSLVLSLHDLRGHPYATITIYEGFKKLSFFWALFLGGKVLRAGTDSFSKNRMSSAFLFYEK